MTTPNSQPPTPPVLLAVDPGTDKVGFAVVRYDLAVVEQGVVFVSELHRVLTRLLTEQRPEVLVLGSGTAARFVVDLLRDLNLEVAVRMADEYKTTEEARRRYFIDHPPKGLWRLVPLGMQLPPRPIDDYAAVIIGERYIRSHGLLVAPAPAA